MTPFLPLETASQRSEFTAPRVDYISRDMMRDINTLVWKSRLACLEVKFGFKFCRAVYEKVAFQLYSGHCTMQTYSMMSLGGSGTTVYGLILAGVIESLKILKKRSYISCLILPN